LVIGDVYVSLSNISVRQLSLSGPAKGARLRRRPLHFRKFAEGGEEAVDFFGGVVMD